MCRLASGDVLISPPLPDITRVNETAATVAGLLGLPNVDPVDNPLDAGTSEITLGSPVSLYVGRIVRMAVPVLYYMAKRHERASPVTLATPVGVAP